MAGARVVTTFGRIVGPAGTRVGDPGTDPTCCCCDCPHPEPGATGCNVNTTPRDWVVTDSGIALPCSCQYDAGTGRYFTLTGTPPTGRTNCLTGLPGVYGCNLPGVMHGYEYADAACTSLLDDDPNVQLIWFLNKTAGLWTLRLDTSSSLPRVFTLFYGTVATADPADCCRPLTFTNQIVACGTQEAAPYYSLFVGVGGEAVATPCCPP